jgi:hypothetical protein
MGVRGQHLFLRIIIKRTKKDVNSNHYRFKYLTSYNNRDRNITSLYFIYVHLLCTSDYYIIQYDEMIKSPLYEKKVQNLVGELYLIYIHNPFRSVLFLLW